MESLEAALTVLTVVEEVRAIFQHGGVVTRGGSAMIEAGEVVANQKVMEELGPSVMNYIGKNLSGSATVNTIAANPTISFDGAVFHGVPDQRYVNTFMNEVTRSLRNSSRSWAFNPQGT
jgi:hypothetical protein